MLINLWLPVFGSAAIETTLTCPVCQIDYPAIIADTAGSEIAIDGQPLNTAFLPLPECPLCGGIFGNIELRQSESGKLEKFIWDSERQSDRNIDSRIRYARLLEFLQRDTREIGLAYLQAAWANELNPELADQCRAKSIELFKEYLASPDRQQEYLFDVNLKIADSLRQRQMFAEATEWLKQMQSEKLFQTAWYPMLIKYTLDQVNARNSRPVALPTGNRLHQNITANDIEGIKKSVSDKTLLNEIDTNGQTPLILAITLENSTAAHLLLEAGADPQQKNTRGETPLHIAVQLNHQDMMMHLLQITDNIDQVNNQGQTPLHLALARGHTQAARILIKAGANLDHRDKQGNNLLHLICKHNNGQYEKILEVMIERLAGVNQRNFAGMTPLHIAARHGSSGMLKLLVKAGAKPDARLANGNSALFFCRPELIATLIELGADIALKNNEGRSAFIDARLAGDAKRIAAFKKTGLFGMPAKKFSLKNGAVNIFELAATGNIATEEILAQDLTQLNAREIKLGETPLHFAAAAGNITTIKLLLAKGAKIDAPNDFLRTPLHYAASRGHFEVVKVLCANKANIHALDARGSTPLHDAAATGNRKIYNYLLQLGASDSTLDNSGNSAASLLEN